MEPEAGEPGVNNSVNRSEWTEPFCCEHVIRTAGHGAVVAEMVRG